VYVDLVTEMQNDALLRARSLISSSSACNFRRRSASLTLARQMVYAAAIWRVSEGRTRGDMGLFPFVYTQQTLEKQYSLRW